MNRPKTALYPSDTYEGPLHWKSSASKDVKAAMSSYYGQVHRSKASGLPMPQYDIREFIEWWLEEISYSKYESPTCGRIDHAKGYSFDNILMQSRSENSKECAIRLKKGTKHNKIKNEKPVCVFSKDGKLFKRFISRSCAANYFEISVPAVIRAMARGHTKKKDSVLYPFVLRSEA